MTPLFGIDSSTPIHDPPALKAAGVHFVCRYVSTLGNPKNLTPIEAKLLHAAGLGIVVVFETVGGRALGGKPDGVADAHAALAQAKACGMPSGRPIYFAVDFDPTAEQLPVVLNYLAGAESVLGHAATGVYGGLRAVHAALDASICEYAWQTYAWSGGVWDVRAHLQQYQNSQSIAGLSVDYNHATAADYGQWYPPAVRRLVGYTISYIDKAGHRQSVDTRAPTLWLSRRPLVKQRGRVIISRRFTSG